MKIKEILNVMLQSQFSSIQKMADTDDVSYRSIDHHLFLKLNGHETRICESYTPFVEYAMKRVILKFGLN